MSSTKTKTKTIRIANDTADYFSGQALNRLVESVHHMILSGELSFDGENLKISDSGSVHTIDTHSDSYSDLISMLDFYGCSFDELIRHIDTAMNLGTLTINDNKLTVVLPGWAEKLSDACHELGYDVEKIVDSAVKSLGKGI